MILNAKHQEQYNEGRRQRLKAEMACRRSGALPQFPKTKLSGNATWASIFIDGWNSVSKADVDAAIRSNDSRGSDAAKKAIAEIRKILGAKHG